MKIKVTVNKMHINCGIRRNMYWCPIALALPVEGYEVRDWGLYRNHKKTKLPPRALKFIHDFDLGKKVKPFSFFVDFSKEEALL